MNWFFLYDSYHVLAGRWSRCEDYIGQTVMSIGKKMAKLRWKKIKLLFNRNSRYKMSTDGCNFNMVEFRQDPSARHFNYKSNCAGTVSSSFV